LRRKVNIITDTDWITILLYLLLVFLGWINIYAAVYSPEHQDIFDISQRYGKQLLWIGLSVLIIIVIFLIDVRFYSFFSYPVYFVMIVLLLGVLLFGTEVNGARSWFEIGAFRVQPAEFAKFATCLALARYLGTLNFKIHRLRALSTIMLILLLPAALILLQNDTGSAIVYFSFILALYREGLSGSFLLIGLLLTILFVAALMLNLFTVAVGLIILGLLLYYIERRDLKETGFALLALMIGTALFWGVDLILKLHWSNFRIHTLGAGLAAIFFFYYAYRKRVQAAFVFTLGILISLMFVSSVDYAFNEVLEEHQQARIKVLLGMQHDPHGAGYNVNQSKIAIGSGGVTGKGFLQGTQTKFDFVPEQGTDFIFCTVGEEWGFLGTTTIIILFVMLLLRLIYVAERQRSNFNRIYGWGVISILFFHFAINVGMTIGLAPVIGIPLPFFSYGGSSLWGFTLLLFVFLKLDSTRKQYLQ
jgi:rod shape determining protein RodA